MGAPLFNKFRKFVTTSVGFSFLVVAVTGIIFKFFFKTRPLEDIHGWLGVAMVAAALMHIIQNWKPLQNHLRDWRVFLLLVPICSVMIFFFRTQQEVKSKLNPKQVVRKLGNASSADLAKVFGKDPDAVIALMKKDGLQVDSSEETAKDLAEKNKTSPDNILSYFVKENRKKD